MKTILDGIRYLFNYRILKTVNPLICGLVLQNKCNLKCKHCTIFERPNARMSYDETTLVIDKFYAEGGRCMYLEGGEPLLWKDGNRNYEDIINYALNKGYYTTIIYTNGTQPLNSSASTIFVSIDGLQETHDYLRGKSFKRIMRNIQNSKHPSIFVNYTINALNKDEIEEFCKYIKDIPQIRGTFFYFHTPYYGYDNLYLNRDEKIEILKKIIHLKSRYRILNSVAGLKSAIRNDWKKKLNICTVYEDGKYYQCCRENTSGPLCNECGYLSYAEIDQTIKLKPGAIINALKYF